MTMPTEIVHQPNRKQQEAIKILTGLLRHDTNPFWSRQRELLQQAGIDPVTTLLVQSFPDDVDYEVGVFVTADRQVYEFGFEYRNKPVAKGTLSELRNVTERWRDRPFHASISIALQMDVYMLHRLAESPKLKS